MSQRDDEKEARESSTHSFNSDAYELGCQKSLERAEAAEQESKQLEQHLENVISDYKFTINQMEQEIARLRAALKGLLDHYVRLVESGDAGNWDCEIEPQVIEARKVLGQ